jgi:hypothetical protein
MQDALARGRARTAGATRPHIISVSALIAADAKRVYGIIADYWHGHPHILPPQFSGMAVERGGVGEGTVIRFQMRIFGRTQTFRAAITEPEPGRVLVETDLDTNGAVTTFTVDPAAAGRANVTIATALDTRSGILGPLERLLTTWALRPIYVEELKILGKVASGAGFPARAGSTS